MIKFILSLLIAILFISVIASSVFLKHKKHQMENYQTLLNIKDRLIRTEIDYNSGFITTTEYLYRLQRYERMIKQIEEEIYK